MRQADIDLCVYVELKYYYSVGHSSIMRWPSVGSSNKYRLVLPRGEGTTCTTTMESWVGAVTTGVLVSSDYIIRNALGHMTCDLKTCSTDKPSGTP